MEMMISVLPGCWLDPGKAYSHQKMYAYTVIYSHCNLIDYCTYHYFRAIVSKLS